MNEVQLRTSIEADFRQSGADAVLYLEGKSDPDILSAILGDREQRKFAGGFIINGVFVNGLEEKRSSGSLAVISIVTVAKNSSIENVFGVIDGDGVSLPELASRFDAPFSGPLFTWKAYCIENLLVKTGWPKIWGDQPDWAEEFAAYGPYVALNRMTKEVGRALKELGIATHTNPVLGRPLLPASEVVARLSAGKDRLLDYNVEEIFTRYVIEFQELARSGSDDVHGFLNGKWIVEHMAPRLTNRKPDQCRYEWIAHARASGGLPEVREWWARITGPPA